MVPATNAPPQSAALAVPISPAPNSVVRWPSGPTADGGRGQTIDGYTCPYGTRVVHHHSILNIFEDGTQLRVPSGIGNVSAAISPSGEFCVYGLHNHDGSGQIHIEPSQESLDARAPDLGLWFQIWGMPLSRDNFAGIEGKPMVVYVKDAGQPLMEYTGDLADLPLISQREITIVIGTPPAQIPTYAWGDYQ